MTPLLANASAELVREWSFTGGEIFWQAVIVLAIVLLNAFPIVNHGRKIENGRH